MKKVYMVCNISSKTFNIKITKEKENCMPILKSDFHANTIMTENQWPVISA